MERKHIALAAFLLAIAGAGLAFAETPTEAYGRGYEAAYGARLGSSGDWMPMAIAAVMICILFNVLLYMMGKVFESEELARYANSEFLQVSASSLAIFFAVALLFGQDTNVFLLMGQVLGTGSSIDCAASPSGTGKFTLWHDGGPIDAFKCKTQEKITALEAAYDKTYAANLPVERLLSTCISMFGAPVFCWSWDLSFHKSVETAHLICTKIVGLLIPLHAQYALAEYVSQNMLAVFLPLGLVLRVFPLTRGVGGLLIAVAIGFFFVWPTFFILTDGSFVKADARGGESMQPGMCFTGFNGVATIVSVVDNGGGQASELASASGASLVYQISVAAMFYPFVALVITLIFIRAATPLFGGDMGELMKMVGRLG